MPAPPVKEPGGYSPTAGPKQRGNGYNVRVLTKEQMCNPSRPHNLGGDIAWDSLALILIVTTNRVQ